MKAVTLTITDQDGHTSTRQDVFEAPDGSLLVDELFPKYAGTFAIYRPLQPGEAITYGRNHAGDYGYYDYATGKHSED